MDCTPVSSALRLLPISEPNDAPATSPPNPDTLNPVLAAAPVVWLAGFGENAVNFEVLMWIDDPEAGIGNIRSDVLKRVWRLFREHGIALPYPQRDIHVKEWPQALQPAPPAPAMITL